MFSRPSVFSGAAGAGPVGPSGAFVTVEVVTLVTRVMEVEGELVEGWGTVDAAAVMEKSCGCDVLLSRGSAVSVEFIMELVLFMLTSVGMGDSYSVGAWTSAYKAILVSLHL